MTAQAKPPRWERWVGLTSYWVSYVGTLCIWLLLAAFLMMPLGQVVWDYWTPKAQGLWQAPAKVVVRGKV